MSLTVAIPSWPSTDLRANYFKRCISRIRILFHYFEDFKILCSGESESPVELKQTLKRSCDDYGVKLIWREGAPNEGSNLNFMMEHVTTDFVFILDDDCIPFKQVDLSPAVDILKEHLGVVSVFYPICGPNRSPVFKSKGEFKNFSIMDLSNLWVIHASQILIRKDFCQNNGPFLADEPHGMMEDDLNRRMKKSEAKILFHPEACFSHVGLLRANGSKLHERAYVRKEPV